MGDCVLEIGAADEAVWGHMVEEGRKIRAPKIEAEELKRLENRKRRDELGGYSTEGRPSKAKVKGGKRGNSMVEIPVGVKLWCVGRFGGMSAKECTGATGVKWGEVVMAYNLNEEVRCAVDAMHAASRRRMEMLAHSTMEEVLEGKVESAVVARGAEWALERVDSGHFGDPTRRGGGVSPEGGGAAIGGIVINLIDPKSVVRPVAGPVVEVEG